MSAIDVRSLAAVVAEPWRNGGGVTRPLATNGNQWRVSVAEVERDGPYSRFDGITRVSLVLRGNGVVLRHGASAIQLDPYKAIEYDGGTAWDASLVDGPVTALNVMTAVGRYRAALNAIVEAMIAPPGCAAIVIAYDSGCRYSEPDTSTAGIVEAGYFMVVGRVNRPLRLEPVVHGAKPPVIATIEPTAAGIID